MKRVGCALLLAIAGAGCRHGELNRGVSHGLSTTVAVEDVPVKGFPVEVDTLDQSISGELLAVNDQHVYVLDDGETRVIPTSAIQSVSVTLYASGAGWMLLWTVAGTLSTASHGLLLVYTAPTWLVVGVSTTAVSSQKNELHVKPGDAVYLWQFARFPAGLPESWGP